jgi:predicted acyl esterase
VRIEVREGIDIGEERAEAEWPLARTDYRSLYLDASQAALQEERVSQEATVSYDPTSDEPVAVFSHTFTTDTELTGYYALRLWVEADGADDMDLFTALQKLDAAGNLVNFYYVTRFTFGHAAHGWLRVSHRELDDARSTPHQPVHAHQRELKLTPGEIVPVDVEIWPSSTLFRAEEQMRLVVMGTDPFPQEARESPGAAITLHPDTINRGRHIIHTGGRYDSRLLVPLIPQE